MHKIWIIYYHNTQKKKIKMMNACHAFVQIMPSYTSHIRAIHPEHTHKTWVHVIQTYDTNLYTYLHTKPYTHMQTETERDRDKDRKKKEINK